MSEQLDALIAEKVLGYPIDPYHHNAGRFSLPWYSSRIEDAFKVFEHLGCCYQLSQSDPGGYDDEHRWWCWLPTEYGGDGYIAMAPTAPLAICRAALHKHGIDA